MTDDGWTEVEPDWLTRACDRAHASPRAAEVGHRDGFCLACAELRAVLGEPTWVDRHEVRVPAPCSLERAFDGEREPQRHGLHALERDVLCRLLSDVRHQLLVHRTLDALRFDPGPGGVRLDAWEVPLLENVWEVLQPRNENNW